MEILIKSLRKLCCAVLFCIFSLISINTLHSQTNSKNSAARFSVKGSTPEQLLKLSTETGRLPAGQKLGRMVLQLVTTSEQQAAAASLVAAQNDSTSPSFHHWLTPVQFGQQFGVPDEGVAQVTSWLQSQGLTVHEVSKSHRFIIFSGTVGNVESAFSTEMHSYTLKDKTFISNSTEIKIPSTLQTLVKGVVRLHSDPTTGSLVLGKKVPFQKTSGQFTFGDGSHYLTPADVAKIYNIQPLYDAGFDGAGQTIAIVGRSNIDVQNVRDFRNLLGLPVNDPQIIVNGDDPGQTSDAIEAMLDITWSGAIAPMATIKFVVSQSNFADGVDISAAYIVDNDLAPVMSTSYGSCEANIGPVENDFYNALWQQAAAEGITSFVSAGDNGGAGCDAPGGGQYSSGMLAVNGLASTPYNVAVGGSQFDDTANPNDYWSPNTDPVTGESALGYIPELVWNESSNDPNYISLYAGSGGVSSIYAKPDWQSAPGVPNDGARDLPDISLSAALHDAYLFCFFSNCSYGEYFYTAGGTSVSSPVSAGIMSLVIQKLGGQPIGLANYVFYRLASVPGVYHDIVNGNNMVPGPDGQFTVGYDAGPGYDLATGLGSFDAFALANNWQAASSSSGSKTTLALGGGQSSTVVHGTPITFNATVACSSGGACTTPEGSVALSGSSSTISNLGLGSATLNSSGVATFHTATVPGGNYNITARYGGDGTYTSSTSTAIPVKVTPEPSQVFVGALAGSTITPAPISLQYGLPWQIAIAVAGQSGYGYPTGNMILTADGQPFTTYAFDPGTGNLNPSPLLLNYGEKSTVFTPGPSSQSSTVSYVVPSQVLGAGTHVFAASYPGDPSFGASQGTYSYNVLQAPSFIADFFPVGTQVANTPVAFAGQVVLVNNGYAPFGGTVTISDITGATPVILGVGPLSSDYGGSYSIPVTETITGDRQIKVEYSGDSNVLGSYQTYTVPFPANTYSYTSLSLDNPNAYAGQPVTLTANVSSDVRLYTATGTVTFLNGTTTIGTANLDANGNAILVISSLPAGVDNLVANYPGDAILQASSSGPTVGTISDFVLQTLPAAVSISEGQTGTTTVNLIPIGGFAQKVTLTCSGMPAHSSCTFAQPTVTLDGNNPTTVALTINSNSSVAGLMQKGGIWKIPSSIAIAGLLLIPFSKRRRMKIFLSMLMLLTITIAGVGCSTQAPRGSYKVTVTATSVAGTTPKSVTVLLTIY